jgi:ubiquinone/menaquinone biosynthesis C-methylase UbiE
MSFYSRVIFPHLLDWSMQGEPLNTYRSQLLQGQIPELSIDKPQGNVLEIGFGTGLNLPYYTSGVEALTVVDPNPGMNAMAQRRIAQSPLKVDIQQLSGEALPMPDHTFDSVVSTWTLCSIPKVETALQEIYRVLKPGGRFFFIEHGLSPDVKTRQWQNRLTPLQKRLADGCHLNRPMQSLIEAVFGTIQVKQFYAPNLPKTVGYLYQGIATKSKA